jgi:hypothetical protein
LYYQSSHLFSPCCQPCSDNFALQVVLSSRGHGGGREGAGRPSMSTSEQSPMEVVGVPIQQSSRSSSQSLQPSQPTTQRATADPHSRGGRVVRAAALEDAAQLLLQLDLPPVLSQGGPPAPYSSSSSFVSVSLESTVDLSAELAAPAQICSSVPPACAGQYSPEVLELVKGKHIICHVGQLHLTCLHFRFLSLDRLCAEANPAAWLRDPDEGQGSSGDRDGRPSPPVLHPQRTLRRFSPKHGQCGC